MLSDDRVIKIGSRADIFFRNHEHDLLILFSFDKIGVRDYPEESRPSRMSLTVNKGGHLQKGEKYGTISNSISFLALGDHPDTAMGFQLQIQSELKSVHLTLIHPPNLDEFLTEREKNGIVISF